MGRIYEVELKDVHIYQTSDGLNVSADIYMKGEKIAMYLDDGAGGSGCLKFCGSENSKREFYYVAWKYFASYPEIDSIILTEYSQGEFVKAKGNLPKVDYKDWPDEKIALFFVDKLIYLYQIEEQYKNAVEEGYKAVVVAKFYELRNAKWRPEIVYYTDDREDEFNRVIDKIEEENKNYTVSLYRSLDDFNIG